MLSGTASISGTLWNDVNANGAWDSPDTRLSGWTVYLDANNNGQFDAGEATTLTNPSGNYGFANLNAGTYSVRYVNQGAFSPTYNQSDHATVTLAAAQAATNVSFGLTLSNGQISGTVLESAGSSLTPLSGFGAYFDLNNNGQIDPGEPWCGTDAQGHFSFSHLTAGTYNIRIDPPHATWSFNPSGDLIQVGTDGSGPASPITFKLTPTSPPAAYQANQIVDYWLIGGSSSNDADRDVGQGLSTSGWQGFVTQAIGPDLAWGVKRIELHNPFGILSTDTAYRADQYLEAQAAGLTWLTSNFASAWKPVTSSGVEVIGYIGSPEQDPSFQALSNNPTAWNARFNASVAPLIAAGMSIAFDMGQSMSQGDLFYQAVMSLKNQGVKVYLENRPAEAESYTWNIPVISTNSFWDPSSPYVSSSTAWAAANSQLSGGVMELFQQGVSSDPSIALSQLQAVLYNGDSAGIHVSQLSNIGLTLAQILTPPAPPTPAPEPVQPAPLPPSPLQGVLTAASSLNPVAGTNGWLAVQVTNTVKTLARGPLQVSLYASTDATISGDDVQLATITIARVSLKHGASRLLRVKFNYPAGMTPGSYHLVASITQSGASNTPAVCALGSGVSVQKPVVDLSLALRPPAGVHGKPGDPVTKVVTVTNLGNTMAAGSVQFSAYSSVDQSLDTADTQLTLLNPSNSIHLKPHKAVTFRLRFVAPSAATSQPDYLVVVATPLTQVADTDQSDKTAAVPLG